jgi:YbbR domain-containing protein
VKKATSPSWISRAIRENFWLKLISLVFAVGFYAFIHSAQNAQRTIAVKLVVEKPPHTVQRKLMTDLPASIDVTLVGPLQQLEALRSEELSITLNLQSAQSIPELKLLPEMVTGLPPRVIVDRLQPSRLKIRFEEIVSHEVRVQVARTGDPLEGLEVQGKPIVDPSTIEATGIESSVAIIQFARTEPFDVSNLGEGKHQRRLKLHDAPEGVTFSEESVQATIELVRKLTQREFTEVRVEVLGLPGARVRPATVTVKVTGPPERVESLREDAVVPLVDPRRENLSQPGSAQLPVVVDIPEVQVTIEPPMVVVKWGGAN